MVFDLYFHNDFDGVASAAVMLDYFRKTGDKVERFCPVDHTMSDEWSKDTFFVKNKYFARSSNAPIILDFPYHPGAVFWFDHHPSAFRRPEWERKFKATKHLNFDVSYLSCCRLVVDRLAENFGYKPPPRIKDLAKWLDIIDAARYTSAAQTIKFESPALKINACIDREALSANRLKKYAELLSELPFPGVLKDASVSTVFEKIKRDHRAALRYYKNESKLSGNVVTIDETPIARAIARFAPLYFHPEAAFLIRMRREKTGKRPWRISAGVNPWNTPDKFPPIGKLLSRWGGGGHDAVGGIVGMSEKQRRNTVAELIRIFNS
jgi:oligoribonuclease NrnB/cAMP/cGMP phosphodiesterase (DHH superfamily)